MIRFSQLAEIGRDFVRISWMHVWYSPDIQVKVQAQASFFPRPSLSYLRATLILQLRKYQKCGEFFEGQFNLSTADWWQEDRQEDVPAQRAEATHMQKSNKIRPKFLSSRHQRDWDMDENRWNRLGGYSRRDHGGGGYIRHGGANAGLERRTRLSASIGAAERLRIVTGGKDRPASTLQKLVHETELTGINVRHIGLDKVGPQERMYEYLDSLSS
ncbi:hypothetical protein DFH09DRAFT_1103468 [Mycena vulgaris]|nr:hypothetical protein DFH09DRAFT_1103468 [Mycena vulgaris]